VAMAPNGKRPVYRFSHFEVDPNEVEIRKHGTRIKLQEQPFKLLETLLQRPGTLVTREELHSTLWPDDTFVDFDHGLNAAAARLRQALGDSARLPRFVESVPRRGYRFIAPVELLGPNSDLVPPEPAPVVTRPRRHWFALGAVVIVLAVTAAGLWIHSRDRTGSVRSFKFAITPPDGTTFVETDPVAVSPDGRLMAFAAANSSGETDLWVRPFDEFAPHRLEGTKGAAFPFWSPDSRNIGFFAKGKLNRVDISGGLPKILCNAADGRGGTWNGENTIVFAASLRSGLFQVAAAGGEPKPLTTMDSTRQEISHRWPSFLPDGRHFLFVVRTAQPERSGIYLGSLADGRGSLLIPTLSNAVFASGHLLYAHDAILVARPFDAHALKMTGPEFPIGEVKNWALVDPLRADFSVSDTGVLVYRTRRGADQLTWFNRKGQRIQTFAEPGVHLDVSLSPDESEVAFGRLDSHSGKYDIWRVSRATGSAIRVTYGSADQVDPVWSVDGSHMFYASTILGYSPSNPDTRGEIREVGIDGKGDRLLLRSQNLKAPWSTNGRFLLYHEIHSGRKVDTWALPLEDGGQPMALLQGAPNQLFAVFSSDGKWIAYASDESGKSEVYVAPFSPVSAPATKTVISENGGSHPEWSRDGSEIYYLAPDKRVMAVTVDTTHNGFSAGQPRTLFQSDIVTDFRARFAVTSDGQRFLIPSAVGQTGPAVAMVFVNWIPADKK